MQIKHVKSMLAGAVDQTLTGALVETLEDRRLLSTYTVTNANDAGAGSLRQAISDANNHAGADVVHFAIGSGAKTINVKSRLPGLGDGTTVDATTQPGYFGKPLIELNGSGAGDAADGMRISGKGATIKGVIINRFSGSGILITGKGFNTVANCYIGTNAAGTAAAANAGNGLTIQAAYNTIRDCVISGNAKDGVNFYTNASAYNAVAGNKVGTDAAGNAKVPNQKVGVHSHGGPLNIIGGLSAADRNIISGNGSDGILIADAGGNSNAIQGNYIGTDATGTEALGNHDYGIEIQTQGNVIGGSALGAGNVISANVYGGLVFYRTTAYGNRAQGNFVGTDKTGTQDIGNVGRGVEFTNGAHDNLLGGDRSSQSNVVSGNDLGGVGVYSSSKMNYVMKNYIGTDASGTQALGNSGAGIKLTDGAGTNIIGGRRAGNVISANTQGINFASGTGASAICGNYIGTDVTGTKDLGNAAEGIYVGSTGNQVGGKKAGTGNVVSGNGGDGIKVANSKGNLVRRNIIGLGANGAAMGNFGNGVVLSSTSDTPVSANIIARNGGDGVKITSGARNAVVSNSIYGNGSMGISIGGTGEQGQPVITSIKTQGNKQTITGTVSSKANTTLYLELFTTTGDGEGKSLLALGTIKTNGSGTATWSFTVVKLASGTAITATATAADGSTSEFAASKSA